METISQMAQAMQTVLTTRADQIGAAVSFTKRPDLAKFTPSSFVQTLVLGWLAYPDARLEQLAQIAARLGLDISAQAIDQRFTSSSAALLQGVLAASLQQVVATSDLAVPILQRFTGVYVQDSTIISLPDTLADLHAGCGNNQHQGAQAALKCGVQLDLRSGALTALDLTDGRQSDRTLPLQSRRLPPGSLRLADLGFYDLEHLTELSANEVGWISKLRVDALVTTREQGCQSLRKFVSEQAANGFDGWVWIGKHQQLRARLLVTPVPKEVADQRRRRIRKEARDRGRTPSAEALALAGWTLLVTNLSASRLTLSEALVLVRVRWQIELLFKLWKSQGQVDKWRTSQAERIRCEVYAKLIGQVIQHWALVVGCWADPERSLVKAAAVVRAYGPDLASTRMERSALEQVLTALRSVMGRSVRIQKRKQHPSTSQRLLALTTMVTDA